VYMEKGGTASTLKGRELLNDHHNTQIEMRSKQGTDNGTSRNSPEPEARTQDSRTLLRCGHILAHEESRQDRHQGRTDVSSVNHTRRAEPGGVVLRLRG
jgi:hypothetical protein